MAKVKRKTKERGFMSTLMDGKNANLKTQKKITKNKIIGNR